VNEFGEGRIHYFVAGADYFQAKIGVIERDRELNFIGSLPRPGIRFAKQHAAGVTPLNIPLDLGVIAFLAMEIYGAIIHIRPEHHAAMLKIAAGYMSLQPTAPTRSR